MKNLSEIVTMFLVGFSCVNFVACSDEENTEETPVNPVTVNPSNVFVNGLPKEAEGLTFIYNADGLLTSISEKEGSDRVSFDYSTLNQSKVQMVIYGTYGTYILDMTIGNNGFVSSCAESGPDGSDTWEFGYTASGNLNYMKRSEGGNEVTNITYANGNIANASMVSEEEPNRKSVYTLFYTSEEVAEPIENKGSIMLFDELFNIDMDEMKYAYYAGLLGKATKNLPVKNTTNVTDDVDGDEEYTDEFYWTLNQDGLPTQVSLVQYWGEDETITFQW